MAYKNICNLLQSNVWADFNKALNKPVFEQSGNGWQFNAIAESGHGKVGKFFKRLYAPYGPYAINDIALTEALNKLEQIAKNNKADYIRIDPATPLQNSQLLLNMGYIKTTRNAQPSKTLIITLSDNFDDVLKNMSKTNQYLWRKAPANNLSFEQFYKSDELKPFIDMVSSTAKRNNAIFHNGNYYKTLLDTMGPQKNACVIYAYLNNKPVAGAIFVDDINTKTRYYMYAGAFDEARKVSAASPLLVYAMQQAKQQGLTSFDMFGVAPKDETNHKWAGFSKFKRSFGGTEVTYNGTYEKPLSKKYKLLQLARKIYRKLPI
ncbi:MAG: hypothetical protein QG647_411 [Patescibacteria group bacterium]|nr:hypothetical protein [Patescibacteria group bacterium]